jgi:hypothetical protein
MERNARIASLEKASSVSASAPAQCALCEGLQSALESYRHDKNRGRKLIPLIYLEMGVVQ